MYMLGGWVNPHREQQTIPQGQTSLPPKSLHANGQRPKRAMIRQRSRRRQARGATHRARPRSPSRDEKRPTEKFVTVRTHSSYRQTPASPQVRQRPDQADAAHAHGRGHRRRRRVGEHGARDGAWRRLHRPPARRPALRRRPPSEVRLGLAKRWPEFGAVP